MKKPGLPALFYLMAILAQAATMVYMSGMWLYPACISVAAFYGFQRNRQMHLSQKHYTHLVFALILLFSFKAILFPDPRLAAVTAMVPYSASYALAQFCMLLQVLAFFLKSSDRKFAAYLPLLGTTAMFALANRFASDTEHHLYRLLAIGFGACILLALEADRPSAVADGPTHRLPRPASIGMLILFTCVLAYGGSLIAIAVEQNIMDFLTRFRPENVASKSAAGFSATPWLGSIRQWKTVDEDELALRVVSTKEPGYMRARTYDFLEMKTRARWRDIHQKILSRPNEIQNAGLPPRMENENRFQMDPYFSPELLASPKEDAWDTMQVQVLQNIHDAIFSTLHSRVLSTDITLVKTDSSGIALVTTRPKDETYQLFICDKAQASPLPPDLRRRYLALPPQLDPRIYDIANEVLAGTTDARSKMRAVSRYFRINYKYELSVFYQESPAGENLINYFLLEKPPAHCEYFATGAAVFLRIAGVPCRYVNGFVAREKAPAGDVWFARNKDAHAWVEAYDDATQSWHIVEATPPEGVPQKKAASLLDPREWWQAFKIFLADIIQHWREGTIQDWLRFMGRNVLHALQSSLSATLAATGLCCLLVFLWIKRRRQRHGLAGQADPYLRQAWKALDKADRWLAERNIERKGSETLHCFARRIASVPDGNPAIQNIAAWYCLYASLRYRGTLSANELRQLTDAWETARISAEKT